MWPIRPVLAVVSEDGERPDSLLVIMSEICSDSWEFSQENALAKELDIQYPDLTNPEILVWKHLHEESIPEEIAPDIINFCSAYRDMSQDEQKAARNALSWLITHVLAEMKRADAIGSVPNSKERFDFESSDLGKMLIMVANNNLT